MSLNIKNPETYKLAQELSALTGESMAAAVAVAVRERLERLRHERNRQDRIAHLMGIAESCAARLNAPGRKMMEIEDLYDDKTGLPK